MRRDRVIGAVVLTGALVGGGVAGAVLGIPGISGAQSTTSEATTTTAAPNRGAMPHGARHFGRGPGFSRAAEGAVVAQAIGISETELRDQLRSGKTIAEVAKAKGVDVQKVIAALVADASRRIDQAVTDKHITAERAASLKAELKDRITHVVNEGGGPKGHKGPGFSRAAEGAVVAQAIGISETELRDQLRSGKTIAEVAKAKGVDVQKVIDALVADASHRIDQAVTDKHITAERAASLKAELKDRITHVVNEGGGPKGHEGPGFGERGGGFRRGFDGPPPGAVPSGGVPPGGVIS